MNIRKLITIASLLGVAAAADAATPTEYHRAIRPEARIWVNNIAGSIDVQPWDKNELFVSADFGDPNDGLEVLGDDVDIKVNVKTPKKTHQVSDTKLVVRVPAGASLNLQGVSSDIHVQGVRGELEVNSVSGDINLDVRSAKVSAQTVSGDLHLQAPSSLTRLNSVSGDVVVRGVQGVLKGEAVSGSVDVEGGGPLSEVQVNSISGDVRLTLTLAPGAKVAAETLSGDVALQLPAAPGAQLTLKTFSGEIVSAYGSVPAEAKHFESTLGDGKGSISLSSFSGDVSVSKR